MTNAQTFASREPLSFKAAGIGFAVSATALTVLMIIVGSFV